MAPPTKVANLKKQVAAFEEIPSEKLTRPGLGEASLSSALEPRLKELGRLRALTSQYADRVHESAVDQMVAIFNGLLQQMRNQASLDTSNFIQQSQPFLTNFDGALEQAKQWIPSFIAGAVEARGFLDDEGIRQEYQRTVDALKTEARTTIEEVKTEATRAIEEARALAKQIEDRARRTAAKVSVEEAQTQFKEAQRDINGSVKLWAWLSALSILAFFGVLVLFFFVHLPGEKDWHVLYHAVLRLAVLSGVGAIAGFCLKMLRAYMNMRERNLHRQRVANSIEAFVVSAQTAEVRDVILAQLVDAVVAFGVSGLLTRDSDSLGTQKIPTDAITRLISSLSKKESV